MSNTSDLHGLGRDSEVWTNTGNPEKGLWRETCMCSYKQALLLHKWIRYYYQRQLYEGRDVAPCMDHHICSHILHPVTQPMNPLLLIFMHAGVQIHCFVSRHFASVMNKIWGRYLTIFIFYSLLYKARKAKSYHTVVSAVWRNNY